jgi:xanthine dehydrogenase accessory factor
MATTLRDMARALGWRAEVVDGADFSAATIAGRSIVIVATQGHGDEEAMELAVSAAPAFVGLVASRRRAEGVLGYLADRGVPPYLLDRVHAPVGLDLGHTSHREIAVAILAELVQERASGGLVPAGKPDVATPSEANDPVCGMTVPADASSHPVEHDGSTYFFCSVGCRDAFVRDPASYVTPGNVTQEA